MEELNRQKIIAATVGTAGRTETEVGSVKLFKLAGSDRQFYKAYIWDIFETVIERAAERQIPVTLSFE